MHGLVSLFSVLFGLNVVSILSDVNSLDASDRYSI